MNGWGSVLWGYGIVAVALGAYLWTLLSRAKTAQHHPNNMKTYRRFVGSTKPLENP